MIVAVGPAASSDGIADVATQHNHRLQWSLDPSATPAFAGAASATEAER